MGNLGNNISESQLSDYINSRVDAIEEIERQAQHIKKKAEEARTFAKQASEQKIGFFGKKKAIKDSQQVYLKYGEVTEAQQDLNEMLVRNQRRIAEITKELSNLGTMSLAMNRATVKRLEDILMGNTPKELSVAAVEELQGVIKDLKNQEDFMIRQQKTELTAKEASKTAKEIGNAQKKTDQRVKAQDKRVARLERNQQKAFWALGLAIVLLLAVLIMAIRPSPVMVENNNGQDPTYNQSTEYMQEQFSTLAVIPETAAISTQTSISETVEQTTPPITEPVKDPTEAEVESIPHVTEDQIPKAINMDDFVGASYIGLDAYFSITKENDNYWFNFVVSNGSYHYLEEPVLLVSNGNYAQAFYDDDHQGYSGSITIRSDESGKRYITAVINDDSVPQYTLTGNLSALILHDEEMHYDDKILEYPIFIEYLGS